MMLTAGRAEAVQVRKWKRNVWEQNKPRDNCFLFSEKILCMVYIIREVR